MPNQSRELSAISRPVLTVRSPEARALFIYGTLLPEFVPGHLRSLAATLTPVGRATVQGRLFDLGHYPGAVIDNSGNEIHGELVEVPDGGTCLALDRYEGCPRPGGGEGLFRRVRTTARLESGAMIDCWIYVYARDISRAPLIGSGCWRTHRGTS